MVLMGKARVLRKQGTKKTRLLPFSESSGNLAGPKQTKIWRIEMHVLAPYPVHFFPLAVSFVV